MARYVKTGTVTGIPALNAELEKIENSFKEMFSRVGELPNQVESDMDMNGNSILNVKVDPANPNSLVSRSDVYLNYEVDALAGFSSVRVSHRKLPLACVVGCRTT